MYENRSNFFFFSLHLSLVKHLQKWLEYRNETDKCITRGYKKRQILYSLKTELTIYEYTSVDGRNRERMLKSKPEVIRILFTILVNKYQAHSDYSRSLRGAVLVFSFLFILFFCIATFEE